MGKHKLLHPRQLCCLSVCCWIWTNCYLRNNNRSTSSSICCLSVCCRDGHTMTWVTTIALHHSSTSTVVWQCRCRRWTHYYLSNNNRSTTSQHLLFVSSLLPEKTHYCLSQYINRSTILEQLRYLWSHTRDHYSTRYRSNRSSSHSTVVVELRVADQCAMCDWMSTAPPPFLVNPLFVMYTSSASMCSARAVLFVFTKRVLSIVAAWVWVSSLLVGSQPDWVIQSRK